MLARNTFLPNIIELHSKSDFDQWFRIKKDVIGHHKDLLVASIYFPSDGSRFYDVNCHDHLLNSLIRLYDNEKDSLLVVGDFNSRTGTLSDIEDVDENLFKYASPCSDYYTENDTKKILELNGVNLSRASQDKGKVNTLGYQLTEFCKSNSMIILNGQRCWENNK